MIFKKELSSTKGMSLIEVMIIVTIMGLVGLGTASLLKNMVGVQKRTDLKSTASQIKARMEQYIQDDAAWAHSVANNAALSCLRSNTPNCTHNATPLPNDTAPNWFLGASAVNFRIYDPQGNVYFDGRASAPTSGFTPNTDSCNTFDATIGSGDNFCPFRYRLAVWYQCTNQQPNCSRPRVVIRGELVFNPKDVSSVNARINVQDYRINLERGRAVRYDTLQIVHEDPSTFSPGPDTLGGGNCLPATAPAGVVRPFTRETYDTGDNVQLVNSVAGVGFQRFRLQPGTYECKVTTQSFEAITGYRVFLLNVANNREYAAGGGFSGVGTTANSTESVQLVLSATTTFELRHECTNSRNTSDLFDLGIPLQDYTATNPTVYTAVTCTRSS